MNIIEVIKDITLKVLIFPFEILYPLDPFLKVFFGILAFLGVIIFFLVLWELRKVHKIKLT